LANEQQNLEKPEELPVHDLEPLPVVLETGEVARVLRVSRYRVADMCRQKLLPHFRAGRQLRFLKSDLVLFMKSGGKALDGPGGWRKLRAETKAETRPRANTAKAKRRRHAA